MQDPISFSKIFIESLFVEKKSTDYIIETYLYIDKTSKQNVDFVKMQVQLLRDTLNSKSINANELTYHFLDERHQFDLMISEEQKQFVVIVEHKGKALIPILFKSGKINSFTTMNKGRKRIFIVY